MLTQEQGRVLVRLARQTIEEQAGLAPTDPVGTEELADPALRQRRGVFVTLNKRGMLRGCIGSLTGVEPLVDGVRRNAINAAFHDHRFPMVSADEVPELEIEVSVLTQPQPFPYTDAEDLVHRLRPGIDGVIIRAANGAGATFLPQVWAQLPTPEPFLSHLCRKAGLPENFWRSGELTVETYQVQHFEENRQSR